jgi:hypothetical protein
MKYGTPQAPATVNVILKEYFFDACKWFGACFATPSQSAEVGKNEMEPR